MQDRLGVCLGLIDAAYAVPLLRHYSVYRLRVDTSKAWRQQSGHMPAFFLSIFRFVRLLMSGHQAIAIENAALRLQLAAFQRKRKRPVLTTFDRVFWIALRRLWSGWRASVVLCPG